MGLGMRQNHSYKPPAEDTSFSDMQHEQAKIMQNITIMQQLSQLYAMWMTQQPDKIAQVKKWQVEFIDEYKKQIKWDDLPLEQRTVLSEGIEGYLHMGDGIK